MTTVGPRGQFLVAFLAFQILAVLKTFPLVLHLGTRVSTLGDPLFNAWILAWDVHAMITQPARLFDANILFPLDRTLAFSDHLLAVVPIFAPMYLLTGNPLAGYNALFILSFSLSGFGMYCLAYYWIRAFWPSFVAGSLFGFAPFRFAQHMHVQLLNLFWLPFALIFLDRFLRAQRWRDLSCFALFYWLQLLSSAYLAYMATLAVTLYASYYVLVVRPFAWGRSALLKILAFAGASAAVLFPVVLPYREVQRRWGFTRTLEEVGFYAPDLVSYLAAPPLINDLYSSLSSLADEATTPEKYLFPGLVLPALLVLGSWGTVGGLLPSRVRELRQIYLLIAAIAVLVSLGPYLIAFGYQTAIPLPYLLLYHAVPGFDGMRVPGRFALLAVLAATPVAALGVLRCCEAVSLKLRPVSWRRGVAALVSAMVLVLFFAELGWKPFPLLEAPAGSRVPEVYRWLAAERPGPIVELPFGRRADYRYVFLSTNHWLPLVNRPTGSFPPTYGEIVAALGELPARQAVEYASALGIRAIVLHMDALTPAEVARWTEHEATPAGLTRLASFGPDIVYGVPPAEGSGILDAESSAIGPVPPARPLRLGLLLHARGRRAWAHPGPHGLSDALVQWQDSRSGEFLSLTRFVRLPLVVQPGEPVAIPLELVTPASPGTYGLQVSVPSRGIHAKPRLVSVATNVSTSRDAPDRLSAVYVSEGATASFDLEPRGPIPLNLTAINTGQAVWLARTEGHKGEVRLGWRWRGADGRFLQDVSHRETLAYDVFPGDGHRFKVRIAAPKAPGTYTLEVGLVSELVVWFSDVGTPPVNIAVTVRAAARP